MTNHPRHIIETAEMLCRGLADSQIHIECNRRWSVDGPTSEGYITRARALMIQEAYTDSALADLAEDTFNQIAGSNIPIRQKMAARKRTDELLGLPAPIITELVDTGGKRLVFRITPTYPIEPNDWESTRLENLDWLPTDQYDARIKEINTKRRSLYHDKRRGAAFRFWSKVGESEEAAAMDKIAADMRIIYISGTQKERNVMASYKGVVVSKITHPQILTLDT